MRRAALLALMLALAALAPARAAQIRNVDLGRHAQVWFAEDHTLPTVSFSISLPAGAGYDPKGKAGLASFAAALLDEGAGEMKAAAFQQALADKAIRFSARVDRDHLVISVNTLSENVGDAMNLVRLALTRPRFDADAVARVRAQIVQSLSQEAAEPPSVATKAFMRAFFNGHTYGHNGDGEVASINAIKPEELRAFARRHWVKAGIKIAVAGDINQAALARLLGNTFGPLPSTAPPAIAPIGRLGRPGTIVLPMDVPQPSAVFGLPGVMRHDPDFIPAYVANYILGGGDFSSRLTQEVRVKRGLTYGINTSLNSFSRASVLAGAVATRADAIGQTIQVVKETMARFAKEGPTQAELDDAKTYLTGSFPIAFASNANTAAQLGAFQRAGLDIGYMDRRNGLIMAVTRQDVQRVAQRLFDPSRLTVVVAGSPKGGRRAPDVRRPPVRPAAPPVAAAPNGAAPAKPSTPADAPKPVSPARPAQKAQP